jgi:pyruvate dehydrogenase E2 component (dihydrolipoamide acetyltransferase)
MRKAIAQATTASFAVPQFQLRAELDATELLRFRQERLPAIEQATGIRITVTDLLLKALAVALKKFPQANAIWRGDSIESFDQANLGLVTSAPGGLRIPILGNVDSLSLEALARLRRDLAEAARSGKLSQSGNISAAASLSNLGASRADEFTALLAQGQTSMLAVGRIAARPWIANGEVVARSTAKLCLTVDHRVLDGEPASVFLGHIMEGLEHPAELFPG